MFALVSFTLDSSTKQCCFILTLLLVCGVHCLLYLCRRSLTISGLISCCSFLTRSFACARIWLLVLHNLLLASLDVVALNQI